MEPRNLSFVVAGCFDLDYESCVEDSAERSSTFACDKAVTEPQSQTRKSRLLNTPIVDTKFVMSNLKDISVIRKPMQKDLFSVSDEEEMFTPSKKNLEVQILDPAKALRRSVGILHVKVQHTTSLLQLAFKLTFSSNLDSMLAVAYHPSSILGNANYSNLKAAYSFYNVSTATPLLQLMNDALIVAKQKDFDVFNALDVMQNETFLKELKFEPGDGKLHYYLYNYRVRQALKSSELGLR
ncbi:hypothetical protein KIW84_043722 [Lathyrus oleraceus]|uniref:Glycylpeptide N-tetradecanoyltransferase n=1 Tax=Pisum sativum TaxID=3888 RepID=A0A9D4XGG9_PEA|nr:hypothetical protein KIW84_043722 [Pisum sativum]